jgi:hypothetical protein
VVGELNPFWRKPFGRSRITRGAQEKVDGGSGGIDRLV